MTTTNRTSKQGTEQQIIQGIKLDLQTMTNLALGGTSYTPTSLVAFIQSHIDAANAIVTAKANWQKAIATYTAIDKQAQVVLHDLKALVLATFGASSAKIADFGYRPRKVAVLTPEQKAAAAVKRAATRKARGTMGPKAKLKVTGATATASAAAPVTPATTAPEAASATPPATAPAVTTGGSTATPGPTTGVTVNVNPAVAPATAVASTSGTAAAATQQPSAPAAAAAAPAAKTGA
jgi:hypothetical protein